MDEIERLPAFMTALMQQTVTNFRLVVCINQPDEWWGVDDKIHVCHSNQQTIRYLRDLNDSRINIIDRSSKGCGWKGKNHGIGWARKVLMDNIADISEPDDLMVSLDADTLFGPQYLESLLLNMRECPSSIAVSVPYYHNLTGGEELDRAILRYEIYMRSYAVNLWRIGSPYSLTALGSAIALPVKSYRKIGGMTPKLSGEDFYFLQKLTKTGIVVHWNSEKVFPAARLSNRVYFGTGPALIRGVKGDWESYPVYKMNWFNDIAETYKCFEPLFTENVATPLDDFLVETFGKLPWEALRVNFRTKKHFVRACHEKIDGLRLLQYLKARQLAEKNESEKNLIELIQQDDFQQNVSPGLDLSGFSFSNSPIEMLDRIRNYLEVVEMSYRKRHFENCRLL